MEKHLNIQPNEPFFMVEKIQQVCELVKKENSAFHKHNYYSIHWITQGEAIHATHYIEHSIKENQVFFVPANLVHKMIVDDQCDGYAIYFNKTFLDAQSNSGFGLLNTALFNNEDFKSIIQLNSDWSTRFQSVMDEMLMENVDNAPWKQETLISLLRLFLLYSDRLYQEQADQQDDNSSKESDQKIILEFKKLIEVQFYENKDVSFYAKSLNMRASCLNEVSKKYTGITAGELIRNRIIEESKKLLYSTDWSSKEIAYHLGFNDPAYFSRFFKKYTDTTLSAYRSNIVKKYNESVV